MSRKWVDRELLEERLHNICKNTCQYAKKGDRPNVMCPLCWLDDIFLSIDELAVEKVDAIPAVPHEMSAVEYLRTMRLICEDGRNCGKCPLSYNNNGAGINCQDYAAYHPDEAVAIVEE